MKKEQYEQLKNFQCPKWRDLPNFDIYMDQVIFFINDRLKPLYFDSEKNVITSNMVNNYVKNSIVKPPIKKHYKPYHLAFLIAVCILKRCYSLTEITQLIEIEQAMEAPSIGDVYDSFSTCFDHYLHQIMTYGTVKEEYTFANPNKEQLLMNSVVKTIVYKIHTEFEMYDYIQKEDKD